DLRSFLFFLQLIPWPPHSPLFPTRRSSDLLSPVMKATSSSAGRLVGSDIAMTSVLPQRSIGMSSYLFANSAGTSLTMSGSAKRRSEEHTSELQSRFDLVCRLLLEKKNSTTCSKFSIAHRRKRSNCRPSSILSNHHDHSLFRPTTSTRRLYH